MPPDKQAYAHQEHIALGRYESPETISFYFFLIGTIVTAIALPFIAVAPTLGEISLLLGVGLLGAAASSGPLCLAG